MYVVITIQVHVHRPNFLYACLHLFCLYNGLLVVTQDSTDVEAVLTTKSPLKLELKHAS